jgi:hypothetical protein
MKTKHFIIAALMGLGASGMALAADDAAGDSKVQVILENPENFSDVRDGFMSSDKGKNANIDLIRQYVQKEAAKYVPDGHTLAVTITNIDLAGDFEPWGKAGSEDIRIVKDIYPPRIDLSYKLTDSAGTVVKEGTRQLRDLNFMMKINIHREDPLRYEKSLINDWIRKDLKPVNAD